jgi:alpha-tubulin suppressor-like RCC1 family protein
MTEPTFSPPGQEVQAGPAPRAPPPERERLWRGEGSGVVAVGSEHSIILDIYGRVFTFGVGRHGLVRSRRPGRVLGIPPAICVAAGGFRSAIVSVHGQVFLCGNQLPRLPQIIDPGLNDVVGVACGSGFIVVITQYGTAFGIGSSRNGELGQIAKQIVVFQRIPGVADVAAVAAGCAHCVYLFANGTVGTMGWNYHGQLGNGTIRQSSCDLVLLPQLRGVVSVSAGSTSSAVVTNDGRVATWGFGGYGSLGHGNTIDQLIPRFIEGIFDAMTVSCGELHTAIVHLDGTVSTFGAGTYEGEDEIVTTGWLGHGADNTDKLVPQKIAGITDAIAVSCGQLHTIIQHADGRVSTLGAPESGCLGRDAPPPFSRPGFVEVPPP